VYPQCIAGRPQYSLQKSLVQRPTIFRPSRWLPASGYQLPSLQSTNRTAGSKHRQPRYCREESERPQFSWKPRPSDSNGISPGCRATERPRTRLQNEKSERVQTTQSQPALQGTSAVPHPSTRNWVKDNGANMAGI